MESRDRLVWLLLAATALVAMVAGHAVELWLENIHAFGTHAAAYAHVAQTFSFEVSLALFAAAALGIVAWLVNRTRGCNPDVLPALHRLAHARVASIALPVTSLQLAGLIVTELTEQRVSGYSGNGLLAVFGAGHITALPVHLIVGILAALALYRLARSVCARTREIVAAVANFLRWIGIGSDERRPAPQSLDVCTLGGRSSLLSLGFANRPPPFVRV